MAILSKFTRIRLMLTFRKPKMKELQQLWPQKILIKRFHRHKVPFSTIEWRNERFRIRRLKRDCKFVKKVVLECKRKRVKWAQLESKIERVWLYNQKYRWRSMRVCRTLRAIIRESDQVMTLKNLLWPEKQKLLVAEKTQFQAQEVTYKTSDFNFNNNLKQWTNQPVLDRLSKTKLP